MAFDRETVKRIYDEVVAEKKKEDKRGSFIVQTDGKKKMPSNCMGPVAGKFFADVAHGEIDETELADDLKWLGELEKEVLGQ